MISVLNRPTLLTVSVSTASVNVSVKQTNIVYSISSTASVNIGVKQTNIVDSVSTYSLR